MQSQYHCQVLAVFHLQYPNPNVWGRNVYNESAKWVKLQAFHIRNQRRILCIKWNDFVTNAAVTEQSRLNDTREMVVDATLASGLWLFEPCPRSDLMASSRNDFRAMRYLMMSSESRDQIKNVSWFQSLVGISWRPATRGSISVVCMWICTGWSKKSKPLPSDQKSY